MPELEVIYLRFELLFEDTIEQFVNHLMNQREIREGQLGRSTI